MTDEKARFYLPNRQDDGIRSSSPLTGWRWTIPKHHEAPISKHGLVGGHSKNAENTIELNRLCRLEHIEEDILWDLILLTDRAASRDCFECSWTSPWMPGHAKDDLWVHRQHEATRLADREAIGDLDGQKFCISWTRVVGERCPRTLHGA